MAEENLSEDFEQTSCAPQEFEKVICSPGRKLLAFIGKDFPGTEKFMDAVSDAETKGFLGNTQVGVVAVDSQACDTLAESKGVKELPTVVAYENCHEVGRVTPSNEDAGRGYKKTIEKLIDLSED